MGDIPEVPKAGDLIAVTDTEAATETPLINQLEQEQPVIGSSAEVSEQLGSKLLEEGIMPAMDSKDLPETVGLAAAALDNTNISLKGDHGLSSASAVSSVLKAAGADVKPTMNIADLHNQLSEKGWQSEAYKQGDSLNPGDLLFTSMERQGRNVGIVGPDGKTVYSHSMREKSFVGHDRWNSKFVSVMRAPEKKG